LTEGNAALRIKLLVSRLWEKSNAPVSLPPEEVLRELDPHYGTALLSLYREEPQIGLDGQRHAISGATSISPEKGMWIYELCRRMRPKNTLEIGFAYGGSALFFLAALAKNQAGRHTAVDPYERKSWHGIGLANIESAGATSAFRFIEELSERAAMDLARENARFDVIFIDGGHRFEEALVDFYLCAKLCDVGGLILFDDVWMSSVRTVVSFVQSNRSDFVEVSTPISRHSVFRRVAEDTRQWDHFRSFLVAPDQRAAPDPV
jgi:predicted O-methyltransferase YrrM